MLSGSIPRPSAVVVDGKSENPFCEVFLHPKGHSCSNLLLCHNVVPQAPHVGRGPRHNYICRHGGALSISRRRNHVGEVNATPLCLYLPPPFLGIRSFDIMACLTLGHGSLYANDRELIWIPYPVLLQSNRWVSGRHISTLWGSRQTQT